MENLQKSLKPHVWGTTYLEEEVQKGWGNEPEISEPEKLKSENH